MRRGLTPEIVAEEGARLADEEGADAVTPAALARRLGVRTASLYAHVDGAADLRARVTALALTELADAVAAAIAGRSGRDALAALADAHRDYGRAHPGRFTAAMATAEPDERVLAAGRRHHELALAALRGYDLSEADRVHAVRLLGATLRGFVTLEAAGNYRHSSPDADATWPHVVAGLHTALTGWKEPA